MNRPKLPEQPKSEYEKLMFMFEMYSKILHPDFFQPFLKQLSDCYEENNREAYAAAKISDKALAIEQLLIDLKRNFDRTDDQRSRLFYIKCMYKEMIKELL